MTRDPFQSDELAEQRTAMTPLQSAIQDAMNALDRRGQLVSPVADPDGSPDEDHRRAQIAWRTERLQRSRRSVPKNFHWASVAGPGSALLARRVVGGREVLERAWRARTASQMFIGPSGAGKTSLACGVMNGLLNECEMLFERLVKDPADKDSARRARELFRLAQRARFVTAHDLARNGVYTPIGQVPELVAEANNATLLVVDDLGMDMEVFRQHASAVREVLHARHAAGRPTIVTTYLNRAQLTDAYGAGIARRLGEGEVFVLAGP